MFLRFSAAHCTLKVFSDNLKEKCISAKGLIFSFYFYSLTELWMKLWRNWETRERTIVPWETWMMTHHWWNLRTRKWIHNINSSSLAIHLQQLDDSLRIALWTRQIEIWWITWWQLHGGQQQFGTCFSLFFSFRAPKPALSCFWKWLWYHFEISREIFSPNLIVIF